MNFIKHALYAIFLSLSLPALADFDCEITRVVDGGEFENIGDFSFSEYPLVSYSAAGAKGKELIVGAFNFAENDEIQPSSCNVMESSSLIRVSVEPQASGSVYIVEIDLSAGQPYPGKLFWTDRGNEKQVAELSCMVRSLLQQ